MHWIIPLDYVRLSPPFIATILWNNRVRLVRPGFQPRKLIVAKCCLLLHSRRVPQAPYSRLGSLSSSRIP
jgi:hypothetical protein